MALCGSLHPSFHLSDLSISSFSPCLPLPSLGAAHTLRLLSPFSLLHRRGRMREEGRRGKDKKAGMGRHGEDNWRRGQAGFWVSQPAFSATCLRHAYASLTCSHVRSCISCLSPSTVSCSVPACLFTICPSVPALTSLPHPSMYMPLPLTYY